MPAARTGRAVAGAPARRPPAGDPPATDQLIAAGWGFASLRPTSVQADNGAGLTRGIIGLVNKGAAAQARRLGRAARVGVGRVARRSTISRRRPRVDAKRVGIEGVSRYGKAALVAMAFDTRFAVVLVGSSGEGGAKLHRRNWGEAVENLTGSGEYHWMAGNFLKYGAADATFGSMNAGDIARRRARADRAVRAAADVHQLRRAREGRRAVARSPGQLHGRRRRAAGVPAARREGPRQVRRLHDARRCPP